MTRIKFSNSNDFRTGVRARVIHWDRNSVKCRIWTFDRIPNFRVGQCCRIQRYRYLYREHVDVLMQVSNDKFQSQCFCNQNDCTSIYICIDISTPRIQDLSSNLKCSVSHVSATKLEDILSCDTRTTRGT